MRADHDVLALRTRIAPLEDSHDIAESLLKRLLELAIRPGLAEVEAGQLGCDVVAGRAAARRARSPSLRGIAGQEDDVLPQTACRDRIERSLRHARRFWDHRLRRRRFFAAAPSLT